MSQGQTARIAALRADLAEAKHTAELWFWIACKVAGREAVLAECDRLLAEVDEPDYRSADDTTGGAAYIPSAGYTPNTGYEPAST